MSTKLLDSAIGVEAKLSSLAESGIVRVVLVGSGGRFDCTEIVYQTGGRTYESWADSGSASPLEAIDDAVTNLLERPGVVQSEVAA